MLQVLLPNDPDVCLAISPLAVPLITAGAKLASSAIGGLSNKASNDANLKINQMNNEFNAREAEKARAFQLEMWDKENAYNTPVNQRKRMAEAGYNPYFGSDVSAGNATGMSGTTAATSSSPAVMQPWKPDFGDVGETLARTMYTLSQKKTQDIENLNRTDLLRSEIWKNLGSTDWRNASPQARKYNMAIGAEAANLQMASLKEQWYNQRFSNDLLRANIGLTLLKAEAQQTLNKYMDQQQQADLNVKAAHYEDLVLRGQVTRQQVKNMIAEEVLTYARAKGQRISNRVAEETADALISAQNMAHTYDATYDRQRIPYAKHTAFSDYQGKTWQNALTGKLFEAEKFNSNMRGWREALNSTNMIFNGVGNAIGTWNTYQNGRFMRSRNYDPVDYSEETYQVGDTRYRDRHYRR